ncbi:integrin alpha-IIb [Excalfactoria chinensis]|uniref:integrin alpha-IIb n=1 Tax=Excalfactoria chinensis TaxID=46218 RepID=UPI003B3A9F75
MGSAMGSTVGPALGSALPLLLLLLGSSLGTPAQQLLHPQPDTYHGPPRSYFGFAMDFHVEEGRVSVAVGAPRANTSQPVMEPGAVFLCAYPPGPAACRMVEFDSQGDQQELRADLQLQLHKAGQWMGAALLSRAGTLLACAPLQHWNAVSGPSESFLTPVGSCYVGSAGLRRRAWISPCRDVRMAASYRDSQYVLDQRYCQIGFSAAVTADGTLALGAPGGYYFRGLLYVVDLPSILSRFPNVSLLWSHTPGRPTAEQSDPQFYDAYRGYSVAVGEFDDNPKTKEFVVGVPNKSNTLGEVEIFSAGLSLRRLHGIPGEQVASYFGHTVAVTDINGDGQHDVLVGAPLFLQRRSDGTQREVGRLYVYTGGSRRWWQRPLQVVTGTEPYGRFAAAIAPMGDMDGDGCGDVAVGVPFGGASGSGSVLIFLGHWTGLSPTPSQRLSSPFPGAAAFGSSLRGGTDIDGNGYEDLLVGAHGVSKLAVYRARPVVTVRAELSVPSGMDPKGRECARNGTHGRVTCFPVQFCVSVSGRRIPESVLLHAELQLDRLKQRGSRRVLLLRERQAAWNHQVELPAGTEPQCRQIEAYLRDEGDFRDKLSPIVTSLSLTLPPPPHGLGAVLYGDTHVQAQTHLILEDCGADNVCVPDLQLSAHTPDSRLRIGADNALTLQVGAVNMGEGAFQAELWLQLPAGSFYQRAVSGTKEKLSCNPRKENGTHVVVCEMGNPMKAGTRVSVAMELSVTGLEDAGDALTFHLQLRSQNSPTVSTLVTVPVEAHAEMELRGMALPATAVLPIDWGRDGDGSSRPEERGVRVEHVYQLHNKGPAAVTNVTMNIRVPIDVNGRVSMNITEMGTEGGINCGTTAGMDKVQDCGNASCVELRCWMGSMAQGQRVLVAVRALLCVDTERQQDAPPQQLSIHSWGSFNAAAMPYHVQPHTLPHGAATAVTEVLLSVPMAVPVWWVVLGVLAGLLLLALLVLLMGKVGFFKRTRPPAEGGSMEGAAGQSPEQGGEQG